MKKLVCEMCGGSDLIKQEGVFVCQNCGTKYSVEEAKKMMMEGTVSIEGTVSVDGVVKVDTSDDVKNLYILARRAREADNSENACKYYNEIILKDPNSWEANFYLVYYHACNCKQGQIANEAYDVTNSIETTIKLLIETIGVNEESTNIIKTLIKDLEYLSRLFIRTAYNISKLKYIGTIIRMQEKLGLCTYKYRELRNISIEAWNTAFNTFLNETYGRDEHDKISHAALFGYDPTETVKLIYEIDPTYDDPFGVARELRKNEKFLICPKCGTSFRERESQCPQCGCTKAEMERIIEERRIQAEKEAEERRIQAEKEAEERRIKAEQEAAEQAARRKEWWQKNKTKVIVIIIILLCIISAIICVSTIQKNKSIAMAEQAIASGDSCVVLYEFDKAEEYYIYAGTCSNDYDTQVLIYNKKAELRQAREDATAEYNEALRRLKIYLEADNYIFNEYSNQYLDKMIKIDPKRKETIYYQNLRKQ